MGFRFRKSVNLGGGFRVNLSKSGIGYSWGTKGFRLTKTANGKTRKTYSIPGTGISYVEEKGNLKSKSNYENVENNHENLNFSNDKNNNKKTGGNIISKIFKTLGGFLLFLILLVYFPAALIIGGVAAIAYFVTHKQNFAQKSLIKKLGTSILLFFMILFGAAGTFGEPTESNTDNQTDAASTIQEESIKEETDNSNSNIQSIASVPENSTAGETPATDETPVTEEKPIPPEDTTVEQSPAVIVPVITESPTVKDSASKETQSQAVVPPVVQTPTAEEIAVYITNTGKKYHNLGCRYLDESQYETTLENALSQEYGACGVCNPPTKLN